MFVEERMDGWVDGQTNGLGWNRTFENWGRVRTVRYRLIRGTT